MPLKKITREMRRLGRVQYPEAKHLVPPKTRGECEDGPRPCPWVGCEYHTYLDVNEETGSIKYNWPGMEPWEVFDSCVLDVAAEGGITLEAIGSVINVTRERVRQVEEQAIGKMQDMDGLEELALAMAKLRKEEE